MNSKKIILIVIVIVLAMQVIIIKKSVPETDSALEYVNMECPSAEIAGMVKTSCYDCHSYETRYPWYSNIAPVSWMLNHHIQEGREHVNFSIWGDYSSRRQRAVKAECMEVLEKGEMPLRGYTMIHKEARLPDDKKAVLIDWFNLQAEQLGQQAGPQLSLN